MRNTHKSYKVLVTLLIISITAFGVGCTGMVDHASAYGVGTGSVLAMPLDGQQECCAVNVSKHIESWRSTLLVLPREARNGLLFFLIGLATAFAFIGLRLRHDHDDPHWLSYGFYIRDNPGRILFDYLKFVFASGILNPKIY